jgi:hypothetical protein
MPRGGLIGALTGSKSWTAQARNAEVRRRCPPVRDCDVKNTLMGGSKPKKKAEPEKKWPNKGSYDPAKSKARGR